MTDDAGPANYWRAIGDVATVTVADLARKVAPLPIVPEPPTNDPRFEFAMKFAADLVPARAKRFILEARNPEIALLDHAQATIALDALGLGPV